MQIPGRGRQPSISCAAVLTSADHLPAPASRRTCCPHHGHARPGRAARHDGPQSKLLPAEGRDSRHLRKGRSEGGEELPCARSAAPARSSPVQIVHFYRCGRWWGAQPGGAHSLTACMLPAASSARCCCQAKLSWAQASVRGLLLAAGGVIARTAEPSMKAAWGAAGSRCSPASPSRSAHRHLHSA